MNHLQVREYYGVKRARASSRVESFPFMEGVPGCRCPARLGAVILRSISFLYYFRPNVPAPLSRIPAAGRHPLLEGTVTGLYYMHARSNPTIIMALMMADIPMISWSEILYL